jgi:hypothetical protein
MHAVRTALIVSYRQFSTVTFRQQHGENVAHDGPKYCSSVIYRELQLISYALIAQSGANERRADATTRRVLHQITDRVLAFNGPAISRRPLPQLKGGDAEYPLQP